MCVCIGMCPIVYISIVYVNSEFELLLFKVWKSSYYYLCEVLSSPYIVAQVDSQSAVQFLNYARLNMSTRNLECVRKVSFAGRRHFANDFSKHSPYTRTTQFVQDQLIL